MIWIARSRRPLGGGDGAALAAGGQTPTPQQAAAPPPPQQGTWELVVLGIAQDGGMPISAARGFCQSMRDGRRNRDASRGSAR